MSAQLPGNEGTEERWFSKAGWGCVCGGGVGLRELKILVEEGGVCVCCRGEVAVLSTVAVSCRNDRKLKHVYTVYS